MTKDFNILKEDFENSSQEYFSNKCPYATAFARQFPELYKLHNGEIGVGHSTIFDSHDVPLAFIANEFHYSNFVQLRGEGVEFHTQIKIYEKEEE